MNKNNEIPDVDDAYDHTVIKTDYGEEIICDNWHANMHNPSGGFVEGVGLKIIWQSGLSTQDTEKEDPDGTFVETVLKAVKNRIEFYQTGWSACTENVVALIKIREALQILDSRKNRKNTEVNNEIKAIDKEINILKERAENV